MSESRREVIERVAQRAVKLCTGARKFGVVADEAAAIEGVTLTERERDNVCLACLGASLEDNGVGPLELERCGARHPGGLPCRLPRGHAGPCSSRETVQ